MAGELIIRQPQVRWEIEVRVRGKDGQYRWFLIRYNPLFDERGNLVRWCAAGTDIEERKRGEERLREENLALREEIDRSSMYEEIVGSSVALRKVLSQGILGAPQVGFSTTIRKIRSRTSFETLLRPAGFRTLEIKRLNEILPDATEPLSLARPRSKLLSMWTRTDGQ